MKANPLLDRLPKHLKQFIKPQDIAIIFINQAVWRCDAQNDYLSKAAHSSYLEGLRKTNEIDNIPSMYGI
jgi:phenylalanine-4-hydroxylase